MTYAPQAVVVVGSLHYDIVVKAPHRPAKGETVTGSDWFPKFGGKGGNQAVAAACAGAETRMVGAVGEDDFAAYLLDRLAAAGLDLARIARVAGRGSGMSVATMDAEGDYGAVIVSGANLEIRPEQLDDPALWTGAALLVLQNEIPEAVNLAAARQARARGLKVCLNAAPMRPMASEFLSLVDILIVNAGEAAAMLGQPVTDLASALAASRALAREIPVVITTAGGDGVALASRDGQAGTWPALDVPVRSTHGAGDVFVGSLCAALAAGQTAAQAVQAANAAAGVHVSTDPAAAAP